LELARLCASENITVVLSARNIKKLSDLKKETNALKIFCDADDIESVNNLFKETDKLIGSLNLDIYNPSVRIKGA
jgi:short-subunit dehydrogenase